MKIFFAVPTFLSLVPTVAQSAAPVQVAAEVKQMQAVEDQWDEAINKRDQYALENLLSPQFIDIAATGNVSTRNQQISRLFVDGAEPIALKQTVVDIRLIGTVAVVNGTYSMQWREGPQRMAEKGVYTHVFTRVASGGWQCINSQRTVVAEQDENARRSTQGETQRKSTAPLPLHIPLIYKGPQSTPPAPADTAPHPPQ